MPSFISTFIFVLLTSVVLTAPPSCHAARVTRRREGRQSQPKTILEEHTNTFSDDPSTRYTFNWAGASYDDQSNGTFTSITGTFTVPTPDGNPGDAATAWVGIDGDGGCVGGGLLQAGVDFTVTDGEPQYDGKNNRRCAHVLFNTVMQIAWYEWFPDQSYGYQNFNVSAGDVIAINVTSYSSTSGVATIENVTRNEKMSQTLASNYTLCGQSAEWIVEDFMLDDGWVPFANFGSVTFTDAKAIGSNSDTVYAPLGANITNIQQNNIILTSVTTIESSLTITHA